MTLPDMKDPKMVTQLGSQLFLRCVSGTRVISPLEASKSINGHVFHGWGSHIDNYPHSYLTVAATIGLTSTDIQTFIQRLAKVMEISGNRISNPTKIPLTNGFHNSVETLDFQEDGKQNQ